MLTWIKTLAHRAAGSPALGPALLRAYSALRPPPHRRPGMEFECNGWTGASTVLSVDGRPIGENNAAPARYRAPVPTEHRRCPFADSRRGLEMNVSAARNVLSAWTEVKAFTALLREDFTQRRGLDPGARLTQAQAYALSRCAAAVPAYLVRRRERPLQRMPRVETALFTMGVAPYLLMLVRLERGDADVADGTLVLDGQRMYQLADASGALISPATGKACAGSPRLITEYFDVMLDGPAAPHESSEARQALARLGDLERFHAYAAAGARLEMLVKVARGLYAHALLTLAPHALPDEAGLLQAALAHCHYRRDAALDDATVASHAAAGALALLDQWDAPPDAGDAGAELRAAALVDAAGQPLACATDANVRHWAATRLATTTLLLQPLAARAQRDAHAALGRFARRSIDAGAFQERCGAAALGQLMARLHQPRPDAPAAVAGPAAMGAAAVAASGAEAAAGLSHGR